MKLTKDESQALAFVALVVALAGGVRLAGGAPAWDAGAVGEALDLDSLASATEAAIEDRARRDRPLQKGERLDPNTASAAELDRLPRVGKGLAERIVADRERAGPFRSLDDLTRVPGIGAATADRLAPHVTLPKRAAARRTPSGLAGAEVRGEPSARLDLNAATPADLQTLPGIGPALAQRIEAWRQKHGRFASVDHLERVPGIGPAKMNALRDRLTVVP